MDLPVLSCVSSADAHEDPLDLMDDIEALKRTEDAARLAHF